MNAKKLLLITCLAGIGSSMVFYLYSPEEVAIHFNARGIADSWASKDSNLILWIGIYLFMTGLYLSFPYILRKTPVRFISMPNKEYWLAPERKGDTISRVSNMLFWFGSALNIFFIILGYIGFKANMLEEVKLNNSTMYTLLGIYFAYIAVWTVQFFIQFKKPA